jgi:hypothetical protein
MQHNIASQVEVLEISMKLESTPMAESSSGMSQILSQLTSLSLQVKDMKKDKGKDKREDIWYIRCKSEGHDKEHCPLFHEYFASGALSPLKQVTLPWCEVCRNRHHPGECYYMKKYVQTPTNLFARSVSRYDMMIGIVGPMTSCMKGQGIYTKFKVKYNKKETLHSIILQEEETSTLAVDS